MSKYKKYFFYFFLSFFAFIIGLICFFVHKNFLIFNFYNSPNEEDFVIENLKNNTIVRKKIKLYYWKDEKFNFEDQSFVWLKDDAENLKHLINNWLAFVHEERVIKKRVSLQSVCVSSLNKKVFCSFDQTLFDEEWSIFKKWHFIEGMFKTIRDSKLGFEEFYFLRNHQVMNDDHLDFSQAWPLGGFL